MAELDNQLPKRTNDQIDKINEFKTAHGEETIPYEMEDGADKNNDGGQSEEEKLAAQKLIDDAAAEEAKAGDNKNTPPAKVELTKEEKEAIARELLGVTDLTELVKKSDYKKEPTAEEKEAELEKREGNKIAYALQQGKFTDKELKSYIADSNNDNLVLEQYAKEQKEADSTLTDLQIEEEFEEKYGLDQNEDSRKYKRGQAELALLKDNIIRNRHGKVIKFDDEYTSIENEQVTQKQLADKVISEAPKYKQVVEEVYAGLKKIPVSFGKGEDYEIDVPEDILNALKERELNPDFAAKKIKEGYTKENKAEAAKLSLMYENFALFAKQLADKINHKRQAGAKNIPPVDGKDNQRVAKKLSPIQEQHLKEFQDTHGVIVAN